jgi:hypothetical protein
MKLGLSFPNRWGIVFRAPLMMFLTCSFKPIDTLATLIVLD